jgi:hypothetical protein
MGSDELLTKTNYYSTPAQQVRLPGDTSPAGARENPRIRSGRGLPIENVPNFKRVIEKNVYPGVDVVYYGNAGELEYDFVVAPRAKTDQIRLKFSGVERLRISRTGDLVLHTQAGDLNQLRPRVYESTPAGKCEIKGRYVVLARDEVGFRLERASTDSAIVIDPVLNFSTYFGGTADEQAKGVAVDAAGNAYIAGTSTNAGVDRGFVAKYSPTGTKLFITYISSGCTNTDVLAIAVDSSGNSYLTGYAQPNTSIGCGNDHVLALKVNTSGSIVNTYGGYFPGGGDQGDAIAVDANGNAYITGQESSTSQFPITPGAFMTSTSAWIGFVSKIDPTGRNFVYSTFLGGTMTGDTCNGIAVDKAGNAYITGFAFSSDFPLHKPYQSKMNAFIGDAFFTVLNAAGSGLNYSTYLGGKDGAGQGDQGNAIAVDSAGNAYVAGQTKSADFPVTPGAYDKQCGTDGLCNPVNTGSGLQLLDDAFVAKFKPTLSGTASLTYSTFLGGSGIDIGRGIAIDDTGNAYVTGSTISADFPVLNPLHGTYIGGNDIFVTKLNSTGSGLLFSTYFGGTGDDDGNGIAMDSGGNIFVAGSTASTNFPVLNAAQSTFGGGNYDAFLFKLGAASPAPTLKSLALAPNPVIAGQTSTGTVTLTAAAPAGGASVTLSSSVTAAAKVSASVTVPAGATSATFSVSTLNVSASTISNISASYRGVTQSVALTVKPITLSMLSIHPSTVTGGTSATGTVRLTEAAPIGGAVVTLSGGNSAVATVPAEVTVGAGLNSASFTITTHPVSSATKDAISATYHGALSITLTVDPPALSALSLAPASVIGGSPCTGTATLTGPARKGGTVVTLTYSNSVASGPATVTVAAGASKATFTVTTKKVSTRTAVKITAAQAGVDKVAMLTVLP